ncbi:MAG: Lrp/AsnC family transcriptional regulator [Eubacteriales bacterium]|nr:Lrp/AsnC family transcriptional regulator [Clostridiales bacterium]MDD7775010.1 Lrp/AsnC family transcriptional regulator [Eubacteriales bacterium]MDY3940399.1 Lrp/AsnC family transcriptional regulator [Eubacteriales bacterium]
MTEILKLIENDSRLTPEKIALMLDKEVGDIKNMIAKYERDGVILGYKTLIDWDKTDKEHVSALIELKITPQRDRGYDHVAQKIYNYPEVESLYLMSGSFDLAVLIEGKTMREVALFVAEKLATIEDVTSTATHFVLRKYKDKGVIFGAIPVDERGNIV